VLPYLKYRYQYVNAPLNGGFLLVGLWVLVTFLAVTVPCEDNNAFDTGHAFGGLEMRGGREKSVKLGNNGFLVSLYI
jgi:hypothetical protein